MKNILCYGDSNTFGYDPETLGRFDETKRWPCLMRRQLGPCYHVIEEGLGGRTTVFEDPVMPGRCGRTYLYPCIRSHQPLDLVILMLGTNDLQSANSPNPLKLSAGLEEIVRILRNPFHWDYAVLPQILVVSPILIGEDIDRSWLSGLFGPEAAALSKQLAGFYEAIACKYDCGFLNAALYARPSSLDAIHLDADGCKSLATAMAEKVKAMLE